ncbi:hypothetical protein Bealeia1_01168 [Candidatus Bealeia paramacronuclearis]|uniref:Uncharacterized protein n=2 Tax=Candidatus Bealeia paramacronuclearis TaxID=1921001 RepID=A0ABZ2C5M5_9PROT|nr:hypothetical protein [Candidatus Bealeia paramacronuclearis]
MLRYYFPLLIFFMNLYFNVSAMQKDDDGCDENQNSSSTPIKDSKEEKKDPKKKEEKEKSVLTKMEPADENDTLVLQSNLENTNSIVENLNFKNFLFYDLTTLTEDSDEDSQYDEDSGTSGPESTSYDSSGSDD